MNSLYVWRFCYRRKKCPRWSMKSNLSREDQSKMYLQPSQQSHLGKMILGWLLHKFSAAGADNFRCRLLCSSRSQRWRVLKLTLLICIFLEYKDGQLTIFTCAVFITAKNLFFVTKMVNVLWNFFLLLKIPRTYTWILLIAEPVAACPSRPWAHIWGRRNWNEAIA